MPRTKAEIEAHIARLQMESTATVAEVEQLTLELYELMTDAIKQSTPDVPRDIARGIAEHVWKCTRENQEISEDEMSASVEAQCNSLAAAWVNTHWRIPAGFTDMPFAEWVRAFGLDEFEDVGKRAGLNFEQTFAAMARLAGHGGIRFVKSIEDKIGIFLASDKERGGWSPEENLIADSLLSRFQTTGEFSTGTGKITGYDSRIDAITPRTAGDKIEGVRDCTVDEWIAGTSPSVFRDIASSVRLSRAVIIEILKGMHARKLFAIKQTANGFNLHVLVKDIATLTRNERAIAEEIARRYSKFQDGRVKIGEPGSWYGMYENGRPVRDGEKHPFSERERYLEALDRQTETLDDMDALLRRAHAAGQANVGPFSIHDMFAKDIVWLRRADTYCWFEDPTRAVLFAASSLPNTVTLSKAMTPGVSGWWYFTLPLDMKSTTFHDKVVAMLWAWNDEHENEGVYFSTYVLGSERSDVSEFARKNLPRLQPTTRWYWREHKSIDEAIEEYRMQYRALYGPGGRFAAKGDTVILDEEGMLACVVAGLKFFAAGCLWLEQKILTHSNGHIERHSRKRLERDTFKRAIDHVRIIQLRRTKSDGMRSEPEGDVTSAREWSCRWGVIGHWRQQYYRSTGRHEAKWIDSYIKGPAGKPFKEPARSVYAVKR